MDGRVARRRDAVRVRPSVKHVDAVQRPGERPEHTDNGSVHQILVDRVNERPSVYICICTRVRDGHFKTTLIRREPITYGRVLAPTTVVGF